MFFLKVNDEVAKFLLHSAVSFIILIVKSFHSILPKSVFLQLELLLLLLSVEIVENRLFPYALCQALMGLRTIAMLHLSSFLWAK